ncbi:Hypothetical predicted protein, partial [Paramuricea clavata]
FCDTVHKYQGGKINVNFNIFDTDKMDNSTQHCQEPLNLNTFVWKREGCYVSTLPTNKQTTFELVNAKQNSVFKEGKIYKIIFEKGGLVYVGSTCNKLETRLKGHLSGKSSPLFANACNRPLIKLIVSCPCNSQKELEKVDDSYIDEYSRKFGERLINKSESPRRRRKVVHGVYIEKGNEIKLRFWLERKIKIKEEPGMFVIDTVIKGKSVKTKNRFKDENTNKRANIVNRLVVEFD